MLEDTHAHDVDIDFFDQNGYLIVRNVLNDESIAALIGAGDGLIHIDFDLINPMIDAGQVVDIELEPGDVLFFRICCSIKGVLTTRANFDGMPIFAIRMLANPRLRASMVTLYEAVHIRSRLLLHVKNGRVCRVHIRKMNRPRAHIGVTALVAYVKSLA